MVSKNLVKDVFDHVVAQKALGTGCETGVPDLFAYASVETTSCTGSIYEPIMCMVLRGAKEARKGGRTVRYAAGDSLIVSHAVPVESAVIQACEAEPYTALVMKLDLALVRSLYDEIESLDDADADAQTLDVAASDAALLDAVARLFALSNDPVECHALAPLVIKEIHFRLLRARHGGMLRQLLRRESPASRISKSIAFLRDNYKSSVPVADLAADCGMSLSAFHEHFKSVTSTTPLQYQKELRLLEARRLLSLGSLSVAATAYDVGYESATQFSREYSRKFGVSPSDHKNSPTLLAS